MDMVSSFIYDTIKSKYYKKDKKYTLFYPLIGNLYGKNPILMVVGRACNGWKYGWTCDDIDVRNIAKKVISDANDGLECPMQWLKDRWDGTYKDDYNIHRSAFWRVSKEILKGVSDCNDDNWESYLAWSNLLKISPFEGGNPNASEWDAQVKECILLLKAELEELKPKYVLMMTDISWAEAFIKDLGGNSEPINGNSIVRSLLLYGKSKIIITIRPEGVGTQQFVNEVLKYI
ncbi:hypothetical protein [Anaerobacterium chartisolvens]|nr:hypothetical protein [Anaerobacterium chartisolvens]